MKTTILFLSLFILTLSSCNKEDDNEFIPTLPPITQTGENTFGCYINGKLLIPRDGTGTFNSPDFGMVYWGSPTSFSFNEIEVRDFKSGNWGRMDIHIKDLNQIGEGIFTVQKSNCENGIDANQSINIRCRWLDEATQTLKWYCSIENTGSLTITRYDFDNRIVSGTFSCRAVNRDNPNDIIEITQGRFDIKWDRLPSNFP